MEMLSSFGGDKQEFFLVVVKVMHIRSGPSHDITYECLHRVIVAQIFCQGEQTSAVLSRQQMNGV